MRKVSVILFTLCVALLSLTGCKNGSDTAYDQVGDMRVFEEPRREVAATPKSSLWNESVPAPAPITLRHAIQKQTLQKPTASRSYVRVGDLDLE